MRAIYIRHADKSYGNINDMQYFKHDPGITEVGVERAKNIAKKLIDLYGEPTSIVSSPYRRTRETSLVMNSMLKNPLEEITIDVGISEYLGNHPTAVLDVITATKIHNPPHPETFDQMKCRVKKHLNKIKKYCNENGKDKKETIWFISHGLIIKQIAGIFNIKTSKQIPYLTCFSFIEKDNFIRAEFLLFCDLLDDDNNNQKDKNSTERRENSIQKERKNIDRFLITPSSEYTGRDDISGRDTRNGRKSKFY